VFADTESGWALVSVSPGVDSGCGNAQVVGEFLDGHKAVEGFHSLILFFNPLTPMHSECICGLTPMTFRLFRQVRDNQPA
jgi:hypothetical protein